MLSFTPGPAKNDKDKQITIRPQRFQSKICVSEFFSITLVF